MSVIGPLIPYQQASQVLSEVNGGYAPVLAPLILQHEAQWRFLFRPIFLLGLQNKMFKLRSSRGNRGQWQGDYFSAAVGREQQQQLVNHLWGPFLQLHAFTVSLVTLSCTAHRFFFLYPNSCIPSENLIVTLFSFPRQSGSLCLHVRNFPCRCECLSYHSLTWAPRRELELEKTWRLRESD